MQFIAEHCDENGLQIVTPIFLNPLHCPYIKKSCEFFQSYEKTSEMQKESLLFFTFPSASPAPTSRISFPSSPYLLRRLSPLVEVSRREANLVGPVDGEGVEAERLEVVEILELTADALLHQRREVHQPHLARVERQTQRVIAHVLGSNDLEQWIVCSHMLVLLFILMGQSSWRPRIASVGLPNLFSVCTVSPTMLMRLSTVTLLNSNSFN